MELRTGHLRNEISLSSWIPLYMVNLVRLSRTVFLCDILQGHLCLRRGKKKFRFETQICSWHSMGLCYSKAIECTWESFIIGIIFPVRKLRLKKEEVTAQCTVTSSMELLLKPWPTESQALRRGCWWERKEHCAEWQEGCRWKVSSDDLSLKNDSCCHMHLSFYIFKIWLQGPQCI